MFDLSALREEYRHASLNEADVTPDPLIQFGVWFEQARACGIKDANAMALATATSEGAPSVRMVLLKGFDQRGFVFYTNYESRKGRELEQNPRASLCFYWPDLERQIRITGAVARTSREESAVYFDSRPPGSRISAAASPQSAVLADRATLERAVSALARDFPEGDVPAPENWGGYRLSPETIEFWQGRPNRLHDRLQYRRLEGGGPWLIERLAP